VGRDVPLRCVSASVSLTVVQWLQASFQTVAIGGRAVGVFQRKPFNGRRMRQGLAAAKDVSAPW